MNDDRSALYKQLPKVDRLIKDERLKPLFDRHPRTMVVEAIRTHLEALRRSLSGKGPLPSLEYGDVVDSFVGWAQSALERNLVRAINGTGIVLHTGLGRAPIPPTARLALMEVMDRYCTLQIDRETGKRGDRNAPVEELFRQITGAESALVVNNNAAATLLILNTLAGGKEVIISRGELVEIGGSFRIPDVLRRSGATMVEVGTTNRTHLKDYQGAIQSQTGLILRVHPSNYRIVGFTHRVPLEDLAALAHEKGILVADDLGSGALVDLSRWGLPKEPMVQESLRAGADVVCFSGDKLLGGPQCGIILGRKELVDRMKKNPLTRALRVDKMTFAVLEATLRLFLDEAALLENHPVLSMLTEPLERIRKRCLLLVRKLKSVVGSRGRVDAVEDFSETGSGSLAAQPLPTWAVSVSLHGLSNEDLAKTLRLSHPPVFGRIQEDRFILDCRTIRQDEIQKIVDLLRAIAGEPPAEPSKGSRKKTLVPVLASAPAPKRKTPDKDIADRIVDEVREMGGPDPETDRE